MAKIKGKWKKSIIAGIVLVAFIIGVAYAARYEVLTVNVLQVKSIKVLAPNTYIAISNEERNRAIDLGSLFILGTGIMGNDGTTAPGLATTDLVPAVVYASSAEVASLSYTFRVPKDYLSGMGFRVIVSSSAASPVSLGWAIYLNTDDTTFAAEAGRYLQTEVGSHATTVAVSNEVLTLDINTTVDALLSVGKWETVYFWNESDASVNDSTTRTTEIKGIDLYYKPRLNPTT